MRSLLVSLMVIAMVGSLVSGGLFAYFSDTETSANNTFTAGTIDITVTGGGNVTSAVYGNVFKPCEVGYLTFTVTNVGDNPVKVYKHITAVRSEENGTSEPELEWYRDNETPSGTARQLAASEVWFDLSVDLNNDGDFADENETIIPDENQTLAEQISVKRFLAVLQPTAPGNSITVRQSFHIKAEVGNWAQTDQLKIDEEYIGLQVTAPAP